MAPVTESARHSASDLAPQSDDALQSLLAEAQTIAVVQDRCIMVEHRRLGVAGATGSGA